VKTFMLACAAMLAAGATAVVVAGDASGGGSPPKPNILVVVLDDIGIDQMSFPPYGWNGAPLSPSLPVLAEIASAGVSFTNFWATPECSPSRAAMLTGRHGFRTGVITAIVDPMLPAVQLHPSEVTVPKLLRDAGYVSGMLGKYHMGGGPENTPAGFGYEAPFTTLGVDFYDGYWDLPPSVDTTLGGQSPEGTLSCGSVGGLNASGAACFPNGTCVEGLHPLDAMALGAVPLVQADGTLVTACSEGVCADIDFGILNAYYVWDRHICDGGTVALPEAPQREYLTSFVSRRSAEWVEGARKTGAPWFAFVAHSSAHTPIQPPPPSLTGPATSDVSCSISGPAFRQQYKLMVESVDRSIGNMLVDMGLGSWNGSQFELGDLEAANTMLIVINDNGTIGFNVLPPFDAVNAKQTVYETGVRSPCIVAGKGVSSPGRAVDSAVSIVDLFGLMCDAAGIDWTKVATPSRIVDCVPMTPYLKNPSQEPIRESSFAIYEQGLFVPGQVGPCINGNSVIDGLITSPQLCADNGGCWAGGASQAPYPINSYCDLLSEDPATAVVECGGTNYCFLPPDMADQCPGGSTAITPPSTAQYAVRRGQWKLIVRKLPSCLAPDDCQIRLYLLAEPQPPNFPGIEGADGDPGVWNPLADELPGEAAAAYQVLKTDMVSLLLSQPSSPADGNLDGVVDATDLTGVLAEWGGMGFWDADRSGVVDARDLAYVLADWGAVGPDVASIPDCLLGEGATLVREYLFEKGYSDATGSGVDIVPRGGTIDGGSYVFGPGQGLEIPVNGLELTDYTIEMDVTVTSAQFVLSKLIDFSELTADFGLYREFDGNVFLFLPPFSDTSAGRIPDGVPTRVTLTRNGVTRQVVLSINGQPQWAIADPLGKAIPDPKGNIILFVDDTVTNSVETCAGSVSRITISSASAK
jgi:arylsulfatase A-like enzyme